MPYTRRLARRDRLPNETHAQAVTRLRSVPPGFSGRNGTYSDVDQQSLESLILYQLVDEFGSRDAVGTLVGIEETCSEQRGLLLVPAPEHAERVAFSILPSYDPESGNWYGVAGLRARRQDGVWVFRVLNTDAKVKIPARLLPDGIPTRPDGMHFELSLLPIWISHPHSLSPGEVKPTLNRFVGPNEIPEAASQLTSALLRHPHLVRRIHAEKACFVDLYHHSHDDLVLEWCCGPSVDDVAQEILSEHAVGQWLQPHHEMTDWSPRIAEHEGDKPLILLHHNWHRGELRDRPQGPAGHANRQPQHRTLPIGSRRQIGLGGGVEA